MVKDRSARPDFRYVLAIPERNASAAAMINYVIRVLQIMICESSMYKHQLTWDPKFQSWRLVIAVLPGSGDTVKLQTAKYLLRLPSPTTKQTTERPCLAQRKMKWQEEGPCNYYDYNDDSWRE